MIEIYTDGACSNNGKENNIGGWGYIILNNNKIISLNSGALRNTTNQQMELTAAIEACKTALDCFPFEEIIVYSDSAYLINCYTNNWYKNWERNGWINSKKQPVANIPLWKELIPFFTNQNIKWIKVKGHTGKNDWNNYVDELAVQARLELENG